MNRVLTPPKRLPRQTAARAGSLKPRPSPAELYEQGRILREKCPRQSHARWQPPADRPDPIALLKQSSQGRVPSLIPLRYERMLLSPFTFYRGAALNMVGDLAHTPVSGLRVQACGDAHLMNFGLFATPERREIFDINDLDETLPAPWEWDLKRLATSFVLAARSNGLSEDDARDVVLACVNSYRQHMAEYGQMRRLDVWYASIDVEDVVPTIRGARARKRIEQRLADARKRNVMEHDFPKLTEVVAQQPVIKDNPPLIFHWRQKGHKVILDHIATAFTRYRETLEPDRRVLLDRYTLTDLAMKVVGIGSVGTRCAIALLLADAQDPLFLQIKEAGPSVLEAYAGKSVYPNHGQRVVNGYRLMQSASDLFLGWTVGPEGRHFYIRQLNDMKVKILVELMDRGELLQYAQACAWALALAHARSGEPAMISGYLGKSDKFDRAIAGFAKAYADQGEQDHAALKKAARAGRLRAS